MPVYTNTVYGMLPPNSGASQTSLETGSGGGASSALVLKIPKSRTLYRALRGSYGFDVWEMMAMLDGILEKCSDASCHLVE